MDKYINAKKLTDQKVQALEAHILLIRQRGQKLIERHLDLLQRKRGLMITHEHDNDGSEIKDSDMIRLNVGGTEMRALRETLTKIKGSRLEVLFSGKWDKQLLHDEVGRVFLDLDVRYFRKIVEHLNLMNGRKENDDDNDDNDEQALIKWPTFLDKNDQMTFDLYIDLFRLRMVDKEGGNNTCPSNMKAKNNLNGGDESFEDIFQVVKNETKEQDEAEKNLNQMEKELEEDEKFLSFFTTNISQPQGQEYEKRSKHDTSDVISVTSSSSITSDISSNTTSSSKQQQVSDSKKSSIVNLWIDGKIISVKHSTLCVCKGSLLEENFNDVDWLNKHTVKNNNGTEMVLMGYSSAILSIINQLRLRNMMVKVDDLPGVNIRKVDSVEDIISKIFPGKEDYIVIATEKGSWKCDSCMVQNKASDTKCAACNAPQSGYDASEKYKDSDKKSHDNISKPAFSFSAAGAKTDERTDSIKKSVSGFTFGVTSAPVSETPVSKTKTGAPFRFGCTSTSSESGGTSDLANVKAPIVEPSTSSDKDQIQKGKAVAPRLVRARKIVKPVRTATLKSRSKTDTKDKVKSNPFAGVNFASSDKPDPKKNSGDFAFNSGFSVTFK